MSLDSGKGSHLYEALSYTWGGSDKSCSISIGRQNLPVTENLYKALLHLQDRSLERILWIDALCIDQENLEERGQQVQLMSKIYSKAARVLIWLGETAHESDKALETIRIIAEDNSTNSLKDTATQQAVLALLERSWFQRIWVLQEVAAARQILVICGSMMVDGYTFYLGASLAVDKVYALLGMSSDDPGAADLLPDYEISWEKLFKKLVKFILGKDVSVETGHSQRAVIKSKGCILGQVSTVGSDERQNVDISFKNAASNFDDVMKWKLQTSAKSIQKHDIICFLQGASKPTIIRLCKDYFTIIVAAVTPLNDNHRFGKQEFSKPPTHFPRDLLLVWDWEKPLRETQEEEEGEGEEYNASIKTNSQVLEYSKAKFGDYSDQATRIWNIAPVFGDLKQFEIAEKRLREAIEIAFGNEQLYTLESPHGLTLLSWAAGSGHDEVVSLLFAKDIIDPDLKDPKYSRTPLSWAAGNGRETVVKLLLETGKVDIDSEDSEYSRTPLSWAAGNGRETVVKLLVEKGAELETKDRYGRTPLSQAAYNGHEAIVKLLVEKGAELETKDRYGQTPLLQAAWNGHEAVVKLLVEKGAELETKGGYGRTPLSRAAGNGHEAIVKLLVEKGAELETKDRYGQTPLLWAAENGHKAIIELLEKGSKKS
ncbi:hypothetical protein CJF31_00006829 [Rutstroemia sp. NJR-2017a BVV2]|nr:hypothetical protein CJF31_00006829 [Rutstroemia sp. NJR-2017a BVV2]